MAQNQNLYQFKSPKSGNEETGFFNVKGRITRKAFYWRFLLAIFIYEISAFIYINKVFDSISFRANFFFETVHLYILPFALGAFILIQGAKRMHDINKSGWYFLIPVYNIFLSLLPGTKGNNDYGIDPAPENNIQFFDELESSAPVENTDQPNEEQKTGLEKWRAHLRKVKSENPNKTYQEILDIARNTFKSKGSDSSELQPDKPKRKSNKYLLIVMAILAASFFYLNFNSSKNASFNKDDSDASIKSIDSIVNDIKKTDSVDKLKKSVTTDMKPRKKSVYIENECDDGDENPEWETVVRVDGIKYNWGEKIRLKNGTHEVTVVDIYVTDGSEYKDEATFEISDETVDNQTIFVNLLCACPYFYYKDDDQFKYGGELIRNLNAPKKERLDFSPLEESFLQKDTLHILIKEEKMEISFLDEVYIIINDSIKIKSRSYDRKVQEMLSVRDRNYAQMKNGDEMEIYFVLPKNAGINRGKIYSFGYYITTPDAH